MNTVKVKIIEQLEERFFSHTYIKAQSGPVFEVHLDRLSPVARKIAESCAVTGVTRFHDRAALLGYSRYERGRNWTARQREVWGEDLASQKTRYNILLPLWGGPDVRNISDPHEYFERVAEMPVVKRLEPVTIQPVRQVADGIFSRI